MTDTVKVRIGGEEIPLPKVANFAALKRLGPAIDAWENATTGIALVSASLAFISALLLPTKPELSLPVLEDRLLIQRYDPDADDTMVDIDERPGVIGAVRDVLKASGLVPRKPPEPPAAPTSEPTAPASTTSTTSSPS